jgi:hypothetical protein
MIDLASMTRFPELENHEDRDKWLPKAQTAVADMRRLVAPYESVLDDRERRSAERDAYVQQVETHLVAR